MGNTTMSDGITVEFPWVESLPKRAKSKLATLWDTLAEVQAVGKANGGLFTASFAAALLKVSRQRVYDLMDAGTLVKIQVADHVFITGDSLTSYAKTERRAGRPPAGFKSLISVHKAAASSFRDSMAEINS